MKYYTHRIFSSQIIIRNKKISYLLCCSNPPPQKKRKIPITNIQKIDQHKRHKTCTDRWKCKSLITYLITLIEAKMNLPQSFLQYSRRWTYTLFKFISKFSQWWCLIMLWCIAKYGRGYFFQSPKLYAVDATGIFVVGNITRSYSKTLSYWFHHTRISQNVISQLGSWILECQRCNLKTIHIW